MSASWRVFKSPPGWLISEDAQPWVVMQRVYAVYSEFGKREWVAHSTHASWNEAINAVISTQLNTLGEVKELS